MKPIKILVCLSLILFLTACDSESESIEGAGTGGEGVPTASTNSSPSFADQADAGEELYNTSCAACHGQNLEGTPVGPIISGESFFSTWALQSPVDFYNYTRANMPPGDNEGITEEDYFNITAYVMRSNGVADSNPALTSEADYPLATNVQELLLLNNVVRNLNLRPE